MIFKISKHNIKDNERHVPYGKCEVLKEEHGKKEISVI